MAAEIEDFWPRNFPVVDPPAPVALLNQQAELLGRHTGGQVEGIVIPSVEETTAYYSLNLKADALGDYLYKLLHIGIPTDCDPSKPFPITAQTAFGQASVKINNAQDFREWLQHQLSSDRVQVTIGNLLRYIRESRKTSQVS